MRKPWTNIQMECLASTGRREFKESVLGQLGAFHGSQHSPAVLFVPRGAGLKLNQHIQSESERPLRDLYCMLFKDKYGAGVECFRVHTSGLPNLRINEHFLERFA